MTQPMSDDSKVTAIDTPAMRKGLVEYAARMVPGRGAAEVLVHRMPQLRASFCVVFVHDALTGADSPTVSMRVSILAVEARRDPTVRGSVMHVMCGSAAQLRASHAAAFDLGVPLCPKCGADMKLCTQCPDASGRGPLKVCTACDGSHGGHETMVAHGGTFASN